jgi:hypothetical protein
VVKCIYPGEPALCLDVHKNLNSVTSLSSKPNYFKSIWEFPAGSVGNWVLSISVSDPPL